MLFYLTGDLKIFWKFDHKIWKIFEIFLNFLTKNVILFKIAFESMYLVWEMLKWLFLFFSLIGSKLFQIIKKNQNNKEIFRNNFKFDQQNINISINLCIKASFSVIYFCRHGKARAALKSPLSINSFSYYVMIFLKADAEPEWLNIGQNETEKIQ